LPEPHGMRRCPRLSFGRPACTPGRGAVHVLRLHARAARSPRIRAENADCARNRILLPPCAELAWVLLRAWCFAPGMRLRATKPGTKTGCEQRLCWVVAPGSIAASRIVAYHSIWHLPHWLSLADETPPRGVRLHLPARRRSRSGSHQSRVAEHESRVKPRYSPVARHSSLVTASRIALFLGRMGIHCWPSPPTSWPRAKNGAVCTRPKPAPV